MANDKTMQDIMAALSTCYGDLDSPDFRLAALALDRDPHHRLKDALREGGRSLIETTDPNDDVSTQLVVRAGNEQVAVELSVVGDFAIVRLLRPDGASTWVTGPGDTTSALALHATRLVGRAGLKLLDRGTATTRVKIRVNDDQPTATVYQALFTNTDQVP